MPEDLDLPPHVLARLRADLDRTPLAAPSPSDARYARVRVGGRTRPPALAVVGATMTVLAVLGLAAVAATGSANPAAWATSAAAVIPGGRALPGAVTDRKPPRGGPRPAPSSTTERRSGPQAGPDARAKPGSRPRPGRVTPSAGDRPPPP